MTPLDFYLWGGVKDKCYADRPETIDALKDNICEAIGEIQLHTIDNVLKNWTDRIMYTYIIDRYNPSITIIDLVSHTACVVCVNFIHKWWDLQFKVDSELQIF